MTEIQELMSNRELLDKISKSDNESPYQMKGSNHHRPIAIPPIKKVSIEEQSIYDRSPRPVKAITVESGRSPRLRRAAERSPTRTIRAIDSGRPSRDNGMKCPRNTIRDEGAIKSPCLSHKVLHNNQATDDKQAVASPTSSISSKTSMARSDRQPDQIYGTSFQTFHTPPKKQRSLRPRIEDDIYDDIDIRKTPKLVDRVLVNNNTPEDDVIDSPFETPATIKEHDELLADKTPTTLDKESLHFTFSDSNDSLDKSPECSMMTPPPPPLFDMEGHGCKCPKKLRCIVETFFFLFLAAYVIATPYVMFITYENLLISEEKLQLIEVPFYSHLNNGEDNLITLSSQYTHDNINENTNNTRAQQNRVVVRGFKEYEVNIFYKIDQDIEEMKLKLENADQRLQFIQNMQTVIGNVDQIIGKNENKEKCMCLKDVKESWKEKFSKFTFPLQIDPNTKLECSCNYTSVGLMGPQGPRGPKGPAGFDAAIETKLMESLKGEKGAGGERGLKGDRGRAGISGSAGKCVKQCDKNQKPKFSTVYTHWGKSSCNQDNQQIYTGRIGSAQNIKKEGGSNYLCLPEQPNYAPNASPYKNRANMSFIYGVQFQLNPFNLFNMDVTSQHDVYCSVCKIHDHVSTIMVPGTAQCPDSLKRVYKGYLMAQKTSLKMTKYICVDEKPDLKIGKFSREIGYLSFVKTRCGRYDLPCRTKLYKEYDELACVVCAL